MKSWKRTRSGWRSPSEPRTIRPDFTSPNIPQPKFMANPKPLSLRTERRNNDDQPTVSIEHASTGNTEHNSTKHGNTEHASSSGAQTAQRACPCSAVQLLLLLRRSCLSGRVHCVHRKALRDGNRRAESIRAERQTVFEDRNPAGGVRGDRRQAGSRRNTGKEVVGIGKQVYLSLLTEQHRVTETM